MKRLADNPELAAFVRQRLSAKTPGPARRLDPPPPLTRWLPLVLLSVGGLTVVQVGTAAVDHYTSPRIDQTCVEHRDCGDGERCLAHLPLGERYCTHACDTDDACPDGMRCGDIAAIPTADRGVGAAGPAAASSACVR